jgi:Rrf2 family nitric oxide-sensitive transcriptional repressor
MNKINRKLEYALMALKHMRAKSPGELSSANEIATHYGTPFDATAKVMQQLAQRGILHSEQGAHGGYQLAKDLARVSLHEVMEVVVGPVEITKCLHEEGLCEIRGSCSIISPMQVLNRRLSDFYRGLMLSELLAEKNSAGRHHDVSRVAAALSNT